LRRNLSSVFKPGSHRYLFLFVLGATFTFAELAGAPRQLCAQSSSALVVGYVFPQNGELKPGQIDAHAIDRINYAFAAIRNGRIALSTPDDQNNLDQLAALRLQNPSLAVLISIGGWLGSGPFSDMALTAQRRRVFIDSVMDFINAHRLDGVDLDWEYPGLPGAGNRFRSEDKENFTRLLAELRRRFAQEEKATGRRLCLSIAAGAFDDFVSHTELAKVQGLVDAVNLMSYDFYEPDSDPLTGNQSPLFTDPQDPKKSSVDQVVKAFESSGVPPEKIILGVPFYAHTWGRVENVNHGLFQPGKAIPNRNATQREMTSKMLGDGFTRYWDPASQVPYLYSAEKGIFVSYEDPESLGLKCRYVLSQHLGGIMFWSYLSDPAGELLRAIDQFLGPRDARGPSGR
jgi:chitinase